MNTAEFTYLDDIKWYRIERRLEDLRAWTKMKKVLSNRRKRRAQYMMKLYGLRAEISAIRA